MIILAIDPGSERTGFVVMDSNGIPLLFDKIDNATLIVGLYRLIKDNAVTDVAIEMVESYGKSVSASIFETCIMIGRIEENIRAHHGGVREVRVMRKDVKLALTGNYSNKDADVRQACINRLGYRPKGMANDMWAAQAVGITYIDIKNGHYTSIKERTKNI